MLSAEISARYQEWLNAPWCDEATKAELQGLQHNEKKLKTAFTVSWNLAPAACAACLALAPTA